MPPASTGGKQYRADSQRQSLARNDGGGISQARLDQLSRETLLADRLGQSCFLNPAILAKLFDVAAR
jgi:hypothetical protein